MVNTQTLLLAYSTQLIRTVRTINSYQKISSVSLHHIHRARLKQSTTTMVYFYRSERRLIRSLAVHFELIAHTLFGNGRVPSEEQSKRKMIAWFGASQKIIAQVWHMIEYSYDMPHGATKERLLWALYFNKNYDTIESAAACCGGPDPKTFRKWVWWFLEEEVSYLETRVVRSNL
jgi:hypothetical protein